MYINYYIIEINSIYFNITCNYFDNCKLNQNWHDNIHKKKY